LEEEVLEEFGEQNTKEQNNSLRLRKCKNASIIIWIYRIISKKSVGSVMNERYLLSNLRHP
jgi:hypothetical protein